MISNELFLLAILITLLIGYYFGKYSGKEYELKKIRSACRMTLWDIYKHIKTTEYNWIWHSYTNSVSCDDGEWWIQILPFRSKEGESMINIKVTNNKYHIMDLINEEISSYNITYRPFYEYYLNAKKINKNNTIKTKK